MKKNFDQTTIESVKKVVMEAAEMKNSFFWKPPYGADGRRRYEQEHSHDRVEWEENGHEFSAEFSVKCTCSNIYAYGTYTRDGKKTTLTGIKNSLKRMEQEVERNEE